MNGAGIDQAGDPEVDSADAGRVGDTRLGEAAEKLCVADRHVVGFALTRQVPRVVRRGIRDVGASLGEDEKRHDVRSGRGDLDGDRATHAVRHDPALRKPQRVDKSHDRVCVILQRVAELLRPIAVAMPEKVDQEGAAPGQRGLDSGFEQLPRGRALPAVQPQQRRIATRDFEIAEKRLVGRQMDGLHGASDVERT